MKSFGSFACAVLLAFPTLARARSGREIASAAGVGGGLVVHVGCGDGKLTASLRATDSYVVQGLDTDRRNVDAARRHIKALGIYGKVTADVFDGERLPYTDNLVNLLVVSDGYRVPKGEMLRVLAPLGVAYVKGAGRWQKTVKPWPKDIDEWTHYLHGPDNNAVARDTVVGPPRHMQWLGNPQWTRNHHKLNSISSVVTAKGRLFYIFDEATAANMGVPGKWSIFGRDAFSGILLWKKGMDSWTRHTVGFRSGPPQVTRLLVASGDRLYAPLGLSAPVSAMDAATGKTLKTYAGTEGAEEIVFADGTLLVLKGSPVAEHASGHGKFKGTFKLPNAKSVIAMAAETGRKRWEWSGQGSNPRPETLASDGRRVYFQVGEGVTCLDLGSGKELWKYGDGGKAKPNAPPKGKRRGRGRGGISYGKHVLVVSDGVVLCILSRQLTALSASDGKKLWATGGGGGGFHAPAALFVIDGHVWKGDHPRDSVAPPPVNDFNVALDLRTGRASRKNDIMVDIQTSGHHHRCFREKATDRYIITGKRGIEMMDLAGSDHSRNNWVRGTCQYGVMPANGLMYAPPHSCGCYMASLLKGFWALAADRPVVADPKRKVADAGRLEKGPAYGRRPAAAGARGDAESWPCYRHDPLRSGVAGTAVPTGLARAWNTNIGGRLTQPVVAGGKVVLSAIDECTVYALDERSGKVAWKHVAGGRVDSPPATYKGTVLFGSADGRVNCLRLSDGELAWRFLAAPADVRAVAYDQVESLWPVHGSVLVLNGVAYCSAGRSTWIDGGIHLYGLDPATGRIVHKSRYESRHPKRKEGKQSAKKEHNTKRSQNTSDYKTFLQPDLSDSFSMAGGTVSDVLVSDGSNVFLHQVKYDAKLTRQKNMSRHLLSTSSLLDGTENHRSHWVLGTGDFSMVPVAYSWIVNRGGWGGRGGTAVASPMAVMMVYDDGAVWGVRRKGGANGRYLVFKVGNKPFSADEPSLPDFRKVPKGQGVQVVWQKDLPVRARAMLKSGDNLYVGAMPVAIPGGDPHAAYEGRQGGMIWVVSAKDGSKVAEHKIESPVVWDGMAAANGRLFLSTQKGELQCWRGR